MAENIQNAISSTYKLTCNKCDLSKTYNSETTAKAERQKHQNTNSGHKVKITVTTTGSL